MNTNFALLARFGSPSIQLEEVCEEFFGITVKTAKQRIKGQNFPVPTFRLTESERAPVLIQVEDLAKYIDTRYSEALAEWQSVQSH